MVKQKLRKTAKVKEKVVKEREEEIRNPLLQHQNETTTAAVMGIQQQSPENTVVGAPAATLTTEEGVKVQVGHQDEAAPAPAVTEKETTTRAKSVHPIISVRSNITHRKGRKTASCTLPMHLTEQKNYPFKKGTAGKKIPVEITIVSDDTIQVKRLEQQNEQQS